VTDKTPACSGAEALAELSEALFPPHHEQCREGGEAPARAKELAPPDVSVPHQLLPPNSEISEIVCLDQAVTLECLQDFVERHSGSASPFLAGIDAAMVGLAPAYKAFLMATAIGPPAIEMLAQQLKDRQRAPKRTNIAALVLAAMAGDRPEDRPSYGEWSNILKQAQHEGVPADRFAEWVSAQTLTGCRTAVRARRRAEKAAAAASMAAEEYLAPEKPGQGAVLTCDTGVARTTVMPADVSPALVPESEPKPLAINVSLTADEFFVVDLDDEINESVQAIRKLFRSKDRPEHKFIDIARVLELGVMRRKPLKDDDIPF
jgi:hypothetical protein